MRTTLQSLSQHEYCRQKTLETSHTDEGTQKAEDKALSETNAEGKMQSKGLVCYL